MNRPMQLCDGEVSLPGGVVAQYLYADRFSPEVLVLSDRYPLGLFVSKGLVREYKELLSMIPRELGEWSKGRNRSEKGYWSSYYKNQYELDAYEATLQVCVTVLSFAETFQEAGIKVVVCHRSRLDKTTHRPKVDRWIEFIDLDVAPENYTSMWNAVSTIVMPVCICIGGSTDLVHVMIPPSVAILKLFRFRKKRGCLKKVEMRNLADSGLVTACPTRLKGMLEACSLLPEYEDLISDLNSTPKDPKGYWNQELVARYVDRQRDKFNAKGFDIVNCEMISLATDQIRFQWLEFIDRRVLPDYVPQYAVDTGSLEKGLDPVLQIKRKCLWARSNRPTNHVFKKVAATYWFDDQV
mmetsp:Transcript_26867/g.43235  ORF Transcript_26867/g.43235 Transcript_26867/m.43235 type:complete len:353 (+) Transcript_26867:2879-3937(+)